MKITGKTRITKDFREKSVLVLREFHVPSEKVWEAFTSGDILDKWWGPHPWSSETKHFSFTPGGYWLYAMIGPEGQKQWGRMNYLAVDYLKRFDIEDAFCNENGELNPVLPVSKGYISFFPTASGTRVEFKMVYPAESDLPKLIEMGFEKGIKISLDQLSRLLES